MTAERECEEAFAPRPKRPWLELPSRPLAVRGLALLAVSVVFGYAAYAGTRAFGLPFLPGALLLGLGGFLSLWAALIHLTGGEEFDDHPFV